MTPEAHRSVSRSDLEASGFKTDESDPATSVPARRVEKPWGYELVWAETELYVGKLLFIRAGHAFSLQFHEEKDETLHLLSGKVRLEYGTSRDRLREVRMEVGESLRIEPGTIHRMEALTDCEILEASTPELDDVVRLEDRYGRAGEGTGGGEAG